MICQSQQDVGMARLIKGTPTRKIEAHSSSRAWCELAGLVFTVGDDPPASSPMATPASSDARTATAMPTPTTVLLRSVITGDRRPR